MAYKFDKYGWAWENYSLIYAKYTYSYYGISFLHEL